MIYLVKSVFQQVIFGSSAALGSVRWALKAHSLKVRPQDSFLLPSLLLNQLQKHWCEIPEFLKGKCSCYRIFKQRAGRGEALGEVCVCMFVCLCVSVGGGQLQALAGVKQKRKSHSSNAASSVSSPRFLESSIFPWNTEG